MNNKGNFHEDSISFDSNFLALLFGNIIAAKPINVNVNVFNAQPDYVFEPVNDCSMEDCNNENYEEIAIAYQEMWYRLKNAVIIKLPDSMSKVFILNIIDDLEKTFLTKT